VLAHEIGHVVNRDPTRLALRSAGSVGILGLLLGDFAGGAFVLVLAEQLIAADYSREAEAAADRAAHRIMRDAQLPLGPFAAFFERLMARHGSGGGLMSHLATHPELAGRARDARDADTIRGSNFRPVLEDQDWVALRNICDG
jgi:Zn-dependent protease with chaperone function